MFSEISFVEGYNDAEKVAEVMSWVYYRGEFNCKEYVNRYFAKQKIISVAALQNQKLVGFYLIEIIPLPNGNAMQNGELCVLPEFQKNGIGEKLFDTAVSIGVQKHGCFYHQMVLLKPFVLENMLKSKGYEASERFKVMDKKIEE